MRTYFGVVVVRPIEEICDNLCALYCKCVELFFYFRWALEVHLANPTAAAACAIYILQIAAEFAYRDREIGRMDSLDTSQRNLMRCSVLVWL